jgi:hypothetical protein
VKYSDVEGDPPAQGYPKLNVSFKGAGGKIFNYPGSPFTMNLRMIPSPNFDFRDGEYYIYTLQVERSLDLISFVTAKAASGNTSVVSTPVKELPIVDDEPPKFERVSPDPEKWHSESIIPFRINITDDGAGVETWTIAYQIFRTDLNEWTSWQSRGEVVASDNGTTTFGTDLTLPASGENYVRFKAMDRVASKSTLEYSVSPDYPIKVDVDMPKMDDIEPPSGSVIYHPETRIDANLTDVHSGLDPDSVEIAFSIDGVDNFGTWENLSEFKNGVIEENDEGYHISFNITFAYGV